MFFGITRAETNQQYFVPDVIGVTTYTDTLVGQGTYQGNIKNVHSISSATTYIIWDTTANTPTKE